MAESSDEFLRKLTFAYLNGHLTLIGALENAYSFGKGEANGLAE